MRRLSGQYQKTNNPKDWWYILNLERPKNQSSEDANEIVKKYIHLYLDEYFKGSLASVLETIFQSQPHMVAVLNKLSGLMANMPETPICDIIAHYHNRESTVLQVQGTWWAITYELIREVAESVELQQMKDDAKIK